MENLPRVFQKQKTKKNQKTHEEIKKNGNEKNKTFKGSLKNK